MKRSSERSQSRRSDSKEESEDEHDDEKEIDTFSEDNLKGGENSRSRSRSLSRESEDPEFEDPGNMEVILGQAFIIYIFVYMS